MNPEPPQSLPQTLNPDGRGDPTTAPKDRKKYRKKYRKQMAGLAVLIIGLAGAAWLSLRSQDPRRRAAEDNRPISRADAAKFLAADPFFDSQIPDPPPPAFADVPLGHPQFDSIQSLAAAGIVAGGENYRPDDHLARAQAAVYILRGGHGGGYMPPDHEAGDGGIPFSDVPPYHWAYIWINRISVEGISQGCSQNPLRYCPEDPTTNHQWGVFISAIKGEPAPTSPPETGGKIAFTSNRDNGNPEIYVMNADGSGLTNLTNNNLASDYYPAWGGGNVPLRQEVKNR